MDPWQQNSSTIDRYDVHTGTWVNWSRGRVFGATLTMTTANANSVIAFTAFFITLVATQFWRISCIAFHLSFSTPQDADALNHQRQVVLRNSLSAVFVFVLIV